MLLRQPVIQKAISNNSSEVNLGDNGAGTEDGVNDPDGENNQNLGQDFGYPPTVPLGSIGDTIWFDEDTSGGDQTTQGSEPGLSGVVVTLFTDPNGDGDPSDGVIVEVQTSDENGMYLFQGLSLDDATGPAGASYVVVVNEDTLPDYVIPSATFDPEGDPDGTSSVTLADGNDLTRNNRDQDFSYPPVTSDTPAGIIGDTIFFDNDGSGTQDDNELGIEGVVVNLLGEDGNVIATATTDQNGNYLFTGLDPEGTFTVQIDPSNFAADAPLEGLDGTNDPDGAGLETESVVDLEADGGINLDQDYGFIASTPTNVGNLVWLDVDADGVYEPNGADGIAGTDDDETLIEGVTVELYQDLNGNGEIDPGEPLVGTQVTTGGTPVLGTPNGAGDAADLGGNYLFEGLPADTYVVKVTDDNGVLNGYWHSEGAQGENNNSQIETYAVDTSDGENDLTGDFGYYVEPGALGNIVWEDINGDGFYDPATEPGIAGIEVELTITYPDGTVTTVTQVTDQAGMYQFDNLLLDEDFNGQVDASIVGGGTATFGNGGQEPSHSVAINQATLPVFLDDIYDNNTNPQNTDFVPGDLEAASDNPNGIASDDDGLTTDQGGDDGVNGEPAFPPQGGVDPTNDFGYAPLAAIGNYIWLDLDMDGVQDANEDGIANVTVNLFADTNGDGVISGAETTTPVATATTGPNGEYLFSGLEPGVVYQTGVDITTLPPGLEQTFDEGDGVGATDSLSDPITLDPNEFHETADFGYAPPRFRCGR